MKSTEEKIEILKNIKYNLKNNLLKVSTELLDSLYAVGVNLDGYKGYIPSKQFVLDKKV